MTVYCVLVIDTKDNNHTILSQEAYRNYEDAEKFIKSRSDITHIGKNGISLGRNTIYYIKEIRVI